MLNYKHIYLSVGITWISIFSPDNLCDGPGDIHQDGQEENEHSEHPACFSQHYQFLYPSPHVLCILPVR